MGTKGKAVVAKSHPGIKPPMTKVVTAKPEEPIEGTADEDFVPEGINIDPVAFLVEPKTPAEFLKSHWERGPVVFRATPDRRAFFDGLFDYAGILSLAKMCASDNTMLEFGSDVNAARYIGGVRETPNGEVCDAATLRALYREGCTFQLIQPQRFSDSLWRLLAAMERHLGCLVGCNAYITPPDTQGLAPHCDDVEIFVCQTMGSKRWRLYAPLPGCHLASVPSGDLQQAVLGAPVLDVTLQVGDVLYMPRGTIHQAVAQSSGASHLTLSTYQRWNYAELLSHLLRGATSSYMPESVGLPRSLLTGLPPRFLFDCGLQADMVADLQTGSGKVANGGATAAAVVPAATRTAGSKLAAGLRALADLLEQPDEEEAEGGGAAQLLSTATDSLAADFVRSRLPPHPSQLPDTGPAPSAESWVMCRGQGLFLMLPVTGPPDQDVPEGFIQLCTCLHNDRDSHMIQKVSIHPASESGDDEDESDESDGEEEEDKEDGGGAEARHHRHHKHDGKHDCCHHHHHKHGGVDEHGEEEGAGGSEAAGHAHHHHHHHPHHKHDKCSHHHPHDHGGDGDGQGEAEEGSSGDEDEDGSSGSSSDGEDDGQASQALPGTVFPGSYAVAIAQILNASTPSTAVSIRQLRVPSGSVEEALRLAYTLWSDGYCCNVPAPGTLDKDAATARPKKKKGAGKPQRKPSAAAPVSATVTTATAATATAAAGGPTANGAPVKAGGKKPASAAATAANAAAAAAPAAHQGGSKKRQAVGRHAHDQRGAGGQAGQDGGAKKRK